MSEIGDSVKIVGEKLIENCETFAHNSSGAHFWKHAAMNIRENLKGIFTPEEVQYMNAKWIEAERAFFSGLVMEAVAGNNDYSQTYKLHPLKAQLDKQRAEWEEQAKHEDERRRLKAEVDIERYKHELMMKAERDRAVRYEYDGSSLKKYAR